MSAKYPIERRSRRKHFPFDGGRNSQLFVNDHRLIENRRRHHGTDPLKDGWDPGEDPVRRDGPLPKKPEDIPI